MDSFVSKGGKRLEGRLERVGGLLAPKAAANLGAFAKCLQRNGKIRFHFLRKRRCTLHLMTMMRLER